MAKKKPAPTLTELLAQVDELFDHEGQSGVYQYTLGRFKHGWRFNVTNSWNRWMAARREHQFGDYPTPEGALQAFLDYVRTSQLNVAGLQD
jgi:hypothetical protein